jgi:hypothetical protein
MQQKKLHFTLCIGNEMQFQPVGIAGLAADIWGL